MLTPLVAGVGRVIREGESPATVAMACNVVWILAASGETTRKLALAVYVNGSEIAATEWSRCVPEALKCAMLFARTVVGQRTATDGSRGPWGIVDNVCENGNLRVRSTASPSERDELYVGS